MFIENENRNGVNVPTQEMREADLSRLKMPYLFFEEKENEEFVQGSSESTDKEFNQSLNVLSSQGFVTSNSDPYIDVLCFYNFLYRRRTFFNTECSANKKAVIFGIESVNDDPRIFLPLAVLPFEHLKKSLSWNKDRNDFSKDEFALAKFWPKVFNIQKAGLGALALHHIHAGDAGFKAVVIYTNDVLPLEVISADLLSKIYTYIHRHYKMVQFMNNVMSFSSNNLAEVGLIDKIRNDDSFRQAIAADMDRKWLDVGCNKAKEEVELTYSNDINALAKAFIQNMDIDASASDDLSLSLVGEHLTDYEYIKNTKDSKINAKSLYTVNPNSYNLTKIGLYDENGELKEIKKYGHVGFSENAIRLYSKETFNREQKEVTDAEKEAVDIICKELDKSKVIPSETFSYSFKESTNTSFLDNLCPVNVVSLGNKVQEKGIEYLAENLFTKRLKRIYSIGGNVEKNSILSKLIDELFLSKETFSDEKLLKLNHLVYDYFVEGLNESLLSEVYYHEFYNYVGSNGDSASFGLIPLSAAPMAPIHCFWSIDAYRGSERRTSADANPYTEFDPKIRNYVHIDNFDSHDLYMDPAYRETRLPGIEVKKDDNDAEAIVINPSKRYDVIIKPISFISFSADTEIKSYIDFSSSHIENNTITYTFKTRNYSINKIVNNIINRVFRRDTAISDMIRMSGLLIFEESLALYNMGERVSSEDETSIYNYIKSSGVSNSAELPEKIRTETREIIRSILILLGAPLKDYSIDSESMGMQIESLEKLSTEYNIDIDSLRKHIKRYRNHIQLLKESKQSAVLHDCEGNYNLGDPKREESAGPSSESSRGIYFKQVVGTVEPALVVSDFCRAFEHVYKNKQITHLENEDMFKLANLISEAVNAFYDMALSMLELLDTKIMAYVPEAAYPKEAGITVFGVTPDLMNTVIKLPKRRGWKRNALALLSTVNILNDSKFTMARIRMLSASLKKLDLDLKETLNTGLVVSGTSTECLTEDQLSALQKALVQMPSIIDKKVLILNLTAAMSPFAVMGYYLGPRKNSIYNGNFMTPEESYEIEQHYSKFIDKIENTYFIFNNRRPFSVKELDYLYRSSTSKLEYKMQTADYYVNNVYSDIRLHAIEDSYITDGRANYTGYINFNKKLKALGYSKQISMSNYCGLSRNLRNSRSSLHANNLFGRPYCGNSMLVVSNTNREAGSNYSMQQRVDALNKGHKYYRGGKISSDIRLDGKHSALFNGLNNAVFFSNPLMFAVSNCLIESWITDTEKQRTGYHVYVLRTAPRHSSILPSYGDQVGLFPTDFDNYPSTDVKTLENKAVANSWLETYKQKILRKKYHSDESTCIDPLRDAIILGDSRNFDKELNLYFNFTSLSSNDFSFWVINALLSMVDVFHLNVEKKEPENENKSDSIYVAGEYSEKLSTALITDNKAAIEHSMHSLRACKSDYLKMFKNSILDIRFRARENREILKNKKYLDQDIKFQLEKGTIDGFRVLDSTSFSEEISYPSSIVAHIPPAYIWAGPNIFCLGSFTLVFVDFLRSCQTKIYSDKKVSERIKQVFSPDILEQFCPDIIPSADQYRKNLRSLCIESADAPHVRNQSPCYGNLTSSLDSILNKREYLTAVLLVKAYLNHANIMDTYGKNVERWPCIPATLNNVIKTGVFDSTSVEQRPALVIGGKHFYSIPATLVSKNIFDRMYCAQREDIENPNKINNISLPDIKAIMDTIDDRDCSIYPFVGCNSCWYDEDNFCSENLLVGSVELESGLMTESRKFEDSLAKCKYLVEASAEDYQAAWDQQLDRKTMMSSGSSSAINNFSTDLDKPNVSENVLWYTNVKHKGIVEFTEFYEKVIPTMEKLIKGLI